MKLMKARAGQALVEYVIVVALVAIMLISSLVLLRKSIGERFKALPDISDCATPLTDGLPPGHGGTPPGHGGAPPGQGGNPPGKCKLPS